MRIFIWLVRAALFFVLLAFALNNQHEASLKWFFGHEWRTPMVFVVLAAFTLGCVFGVLAMVPSWWRARQAARQQPGDPTASSSVDSRSTDPALPSDARLLQHEL
ncbi:lipopolysaccharide assembly protein LapA domain-containing protein [Rhizobacter sp. J219]|jgi:putative membrane protein|uniref:LapA family protein n=1 Tax=Rhizobacter sp. J219 TaxID=2898430 RepID=UPI002151A5F8|nr:lipopolysaccharide assembly protein LapA domain-containing protein [Rhizobacter sp. J219]MCR5881449.1 lipopolysaccharide assembly protein LapA domain-containing protein [Rhizobacter sp. J219]